MKDGVFHVVQLTLLPELDYRAIDTPGDVQCTYLSIGNLQGHGVKKGIQVRRPWFPPFCTARTCTTSPKQDSRNKLADAQEPAKLPRSDPRKVGQQEPGLGIDVDYKDVDQAAAIFEYGSILRGVRSRCPMRKA